MTAADLMPLVLALIDADDDKIKYTGNMRSFVQASRKFTAAMRELRKAVGREIVDRQGIFTLADSPGEEAAKP